MNEELVKNEAELRKAILKFRKQKSPGRIVLEEGNYFLSEPLELSEDDSALTLEGRGEAHLFGGRRVINWRVEDGFWKANVPETQSGAWDFRMLMVNGRYAERARYPETGYLLHRSEFDVSWRSTYEGGFERQPTDEELRTLHYFEKDIPEGFEPKNAEITVFHMWDESLVGVKSINRSKQEIIFSNLPGWPPGAFAKEHSFDKRYIIWNTKEGLTKPGQWYLDRSSGEIVYYPMENESIEEIHAIAPVHFNVFRISGSTTPAENITLRNLHISSTNAPLMSGAFGAKLFDGAISMINTRDCKLVDLHIENVGGHCIKADGNNLRIENCHLSHAGAGAIRLTGSDALVRNNHIHHIGRTFPSAIALYVGATDPNVPEEWEPGRSYTNCTIEHNEIHQVPYAAICAGGNNLIIRKNLIYEAMQDLYDGAGIYITFCNNAQVTHNFIRDIKDKPGAGTSAYYLDEKSVNCLVEENLEINVPRASHNHIASNNRFRNNFFIMKGRGWFTMERSNDYTFENNVVITGDGFDIWDLKFCPAFKNNILYPGKGKLGTKDLERYTILKEYPLELKDQNSDEDPMVLEYNSGKIVCDPNSPIFKMGIKPIDVSDAGLQRNK